MPSVRFSELCHFTDKQLIATAAADAHRYMLFGGARGPEIVLAALVVGALPHAGGCYNTACGGCA